jgi:hypothetical protein
MVVILALPKEVATWRGVPPVLGSTYNAREGTVERSEVAMDQKDGVEAEICEGSEEEGVSPVRRWWYSVGWGEVDLDLNNLLLLLLVLLLAA